MKGTVRFRKRGSVAHSTLLTIVMMCINDVEEIIVDEAAIDIVFSQDSHHCTVLLHVTLKYGANIIQLGEKLQQHIKNEIEVMTKFRVENVHITVKRLV